MTDTGPRSLIAGCGKIGVRLGQALAEAGHRVWGLRRRSEPLPPPLTGLQADLLAPARLAEVLPGDLDCVFYLATPSRYDDAGYREAYVSGLVNLLSALDARRQRPRRVVFVSSTAVYGQADGSWVDEDSPTEPRGFNGRRVLEAEQALLGSSHHGTVVRFGGIYGPGRERMLRKVEAGDPCHADPPQYTNRIHEDDCIGVLAHIAALQAADSRYLAVDDHPSSECEVMDWLAERLDRPRPERIPAPPDGGRAGNKRCSNARLKASGYRFIYPSFREGYAAMLAAR